MEEFFKRLYNITMSEQWKFEVISINKFDLGDVTNYALTIDVSDITDPNSEHRQIELNYEVPNFVSGVVNNNEFNKVTITSARLRPAIKYYSNQIKISGLYIDLSQNYIDFYNGNNYELTRVLKYFNILDKVYPDVTPEYVDELDPDSIEFIKSFTPKKESVAKLKLIYCDSNIPSEFNGEFLLKLIKSIESPNRDIVTPLDFSYLDVISGLVYELYQHMGEFKKNNYHHFYNNGTLYSNSIQSVISRYFRLQATHFRNVQSSQDVNALSMASQAKRVYFYTGDSESGYNKMRMYNNYFIGVLDPTRTHDGPHINADNDLTINTKIENGTIKIKLYNKKFELVDVDYVDYCTSKVLSENQVDEVNKKIHDDNGVYVVYQFGKYYEITNPDEIDYYRPANNLLSPTTSLVPFINRSDSTRAMLGAHMIRQSIPVNGSVPAIVHTPGASDLYNNSGINIKSKVDGKVIDIFEDKWVKIQKDDNTIEIMKSPEWFNSKSSTTNIFNTLVKVGDTVKKGDVLFSPNSFKDGEFATGVPLYTAFTTYLGHDHEDGIVMTESASKKFSHPMYKTIEYNLPNTMYYQFNNLEIPGDPSKYSEYGLIKEGEAVNSGDTLFSFWIYTDENSRYGKLKSLWDAQDTLHHEIYKVPANITSGIIKSVDVRCQYPNSGDGNDSFVKYYNDLRNEKLKKEATFTGELINDNYEFDDSTIFYKVIITIEYYNNVKLGDKFSNLYGSKGVSCYIIPDEEAPQDEFGNTIEVIISPLSTFSRKNPSQLFEAKLGLIGKVGFKYLENHRYDSDKTDLVNFLTVAYPNIEWNEDEIKKLYESSKKYGFIRFLVSPFEQYYDDAVINKLLEMLGYGDGTSKIFYPKLGKWTNTKVTIGCSNIIRLQFIVEDKATATSMLNISTELPFGMGKIKSEGQKIGNQEIWALQSHGKSAELAEISAENEDKSPVFISSLLSLGLSL